MRRIGFTLNGQAVAYQVADDTPLVAILRDHENLTAAKPACEIGRCGACTVLLDGEPANACLILPHRLDGRVVISAEGLDVLPEARIVREALDAECSFQCGYCAPGFTVALVALLQREPDADETAIRAALVGNICRCTGYHSILRGALTAVAMLKEARR